MVISHFASLFRFRHHEVYFMTDRLFHLYGREIKYKGQHLRLEMSKDKALSQSAVCKWQPIIISNYLPSQL